MSSNSAGAEDGDRPGRLATTASSEVAVPDFGSFMRLVFADGRDGDGSSLGGLTTLRANGPALIRRDFEVAMTLLKRAAEAIPVLLRHCQQLEADLRRVRADAAADVQEANGETQQWQQIAVAMKMHIEENEHEIALMRKRLNAAEERLSTGHTIAQQAEQQAHLAMEITTLFHNKIVDAFGVGSPAHAAVDAALRPGETDRRER